MIHRLFCGTDDAMLSSILTSGMWAGNSQDLLALLPQHNLNHPPLPIRDAIDFVYTCIYSTTKAIKFSWHLQVCGGPIEIAVITTDREFRWVRHKQWDTAINEG